MVKERAILFSADMVRALLAVRKTQTRRTVKPLIRNGVTLQWHPNGYYLQKSDITGFFDNNVIKSPYGIVGDLLYVKEVHKYIDIGSGQVEVEYLADGRREWCSVTDEQDAKINRVLRKRPSIHMPRWASRIQLEITGIRVERLQDISEADAIAEGIYEVWPGRWHWMDVGICTYQTAREAYFALWESINGTGSVEANPYVWVIDFRRVRP